MRKSCGGCSLHALAAAREGPPLTGLSESGPEAGGASPSVSAPPGLGASRPAAADAGLSFSGVPAPAANGMEGAAALRGASTTAGVHEDAAQIAAISVRAGVGAKLIQEERWGSGGDSFDCPTDSGCPANADAE